jgi:hypothetical protein
VADLPFTAFATFLSLFPDITVDVTCAFNKQAIPTQHLLCSPYIMKGFTELVAQESSQIAEVLSHDWEEPREEQEDHGLPGDKGS